MSDVLTSVMPQPGPVDGRVTFPEAGRSWTGMHGGLVVSALVDRAAREARRDSGRQRGGTCRISRSPRECHGSTHSTT